MSIISLPGDPAIQVIDFLRSFKEAADLNGVSEAAAAVLLPYFLDSRAKAGLSSRMKHIPVSMPKFPAAVQWLLQSFATEAVIAASYQKVFTARQMVGEDEKQYATRLKQYAAEAGSVFTEDSLISAFVDGLHPYASNTVRGQVTPTMMFAEVQLLAEQAGTASRALTSLARAPPRVGHPAMNPLRSRPVFAAAVESYTRDADMHYDRLDGNEYAPGLVVGALNSPPHRGTESEFSETCSVSFVPSSISAPTRSWVSAPGSARSAHVPDYPRLQEVNAVDYRSRTCHLCFNPGHFIMECPFLGKEARQLVQENRMRATRGKTSRQEATPKLPANPEHPHEQRAPSIYWYPTRLTERRHQQHAVHPVLEEPERTAGKFRISSRRRKTGRDTCRDAWSP